MESEKAIIINPELDDASLTEVEKQNVKGGVKANHWTDSFVPSLFQAHDDSVEEKLGYAPIIRDLKETQGTDITVLDYGCGPGKVSRRLVKENIRQVEAVDISQDMIREAVSHSLKESISRINYQKIKSGELPFADNYFDAAICCFVLINITCRNEFVKVIGEIYRVLKPGGTFYILDIDTKHVGIRFRTFYNGDPGVIYRDGDALPGYIKVSEQEVLKVIGTYWTKNTYEDFLRSVGFTVQVLEFTAANLPEEEKHLLGVNEMLHSPFFIFKAIKPQL